MSTRSDIIIKREDGKWARSYCHSDGYLDHVGRVLLESYQDAGKVDALSALGDLSSLHERIDAPRGHSFANRKEGCTVAYGRDRGDQGCEATTGATLADVWPPAESWTEYTYVWNGEEWFVGDPATPLDEQELECLSDAILNHDREAAADAEA